jgi:hypothetical protein
MWRAKQRQKIAPVFLKKLLRFEDYDVVVAAAAADDDGDER